MRGTAIQSEIRALFRAGVATPLHVDLLLALRSAEGTPLTVDALVERVSVVGESVVRRCLRDLDASGLVRELADRPAWLYVPSTPTLRSAVDALAMARHAAPDEVLRVLYAHSMAWGR